MLQPSRVALVFLFLLALPLAAAEKPLTNADVVALAEAGLGDDLICAKIRESKAVNFDLSTSGLVALKKKHVSDKVIQQMMDWGKQADAPPPKTDSAPATATDEKQPGTMSRVKDRMKSALHRESPEEEKKQEEAERQKDAQGIGRSVNDPCVKNFKKEGSFFSGYRFSTFAMVPNVSKSKAFDILATKLAQGGWQVVSSNKDAGIISASQGVNSPQVKTVPLNITVEEAKSGAQVTLVLQLGHGLVASSSTVEKQFCEFIDAVH